MHHLVSQIVQLANVRIAKLRDVPAGKLAEAAKVNVIKDVLVLQILLALVIVGSRTLVH